MQTKITLAALLFASPTAYAGGHQPRLNTVYADTASEIYAAYTSGKPTLIKVAAGTYTFSTSFESEAYGRSTLPPLANTIVIEGQDPASTVFEGGRHFTVAAGGKLTLKNVTLASGQETCPQDNCAAFGGGAAANFGGSLRFENCVIQNNHSAHIDGLVPTYGGAILNAAGDLYIGTSMLTGNGSAYFGGAIALLGGTGVIRHSSISGNRTVVGGMGGYILAPGGGIYASNADLTIFDSTVSGNITAFPSTDWIGDGAGLYVASGNVWIVNSAITENRSEPYGLGGGIFNNGRMHIIDSTVGGNFAGQAGGGIHNTGQLKLQGVTIAGNEAGGDIPSYAGMCISDPCYRGAGGIWSDPKGSVEIRQSLIANNSYWNSGADCTGTLSSDGHNAIKNIATCVINPASGDRLGMKVGLGDLQDDGEPGDAHYPLLAGSPLIDAGGKEGQDCTDGDQFGHDREDGNGDGKVRCDIGAVELQPNGP